MAVQIEFFETVAQVIPVMFLTLVLEKRFRTDQNRRLRIGRTAELSLLVVAEAIALGAIAAGEAPPFAAVTVVGALFVATATFVGLALLPDMDAVSDVREGRIHLAIMGTTLLALVVGLCWFVARAVGA